MVECKESVEQPRQPTEGSSENLVPEATEARQTSITDYFSPRPTSSADVPKSSDTIRTFTLPPFITPCPSVRLAEVSAVFQVSECVAKHHFDPTRPLSECGLLKSSVKESSVETNSLPAQGGSGTDSDNEQYWIRQDEERLEVIREMEKEMVETKAQLASMTSAFQMASDSSKEAIAKALEDAKNDKKSQQRKMESKIDSLKSEMDSLQSQLAERCKREAALTKIFSRVADFDRWKDLEEILDTLASQAGTLPKQLEEALLMYHKEIGEYGKLWNAHQQLLKNHTISKNVLQNIKKMDLKVIRELNGCLRQVFERMIRCSLLLEDEGYRPFDREHRAICEKVLNLTGQDYQQALIDYYKDHAISDGFALFPDDDETEHEAGGHVVNGGGQFGNADYHDQANEGPAEAHTENRRIDPSTFIAGYANSVEDSSLGPGRYPELVHTAEPEEVQEWPQLSDVEARSAFDVSEDRTLANPLVDGDIPRIADMNAYLESLPIRNLDNTFWDDAEFDNRYENCVDDVESFDDERTESTADNEEGPERVGEAEFFELESAADAGNAEDRNLGVPGVSKDSETAASENPGLSEGFAFHFTIPSDGNDPKVVNPFAFGTGESPPAFVFAASTAASESKSDERSQPAKLSKTSTPAGIKRNGQDLGEELSFDTADKKSFSFNAPLAADLGASASGKSAFYNPFTTSQPAEAETPTLRYPELQQDSKATKPQCEGAPGISNGPPTSEQRPAIGFNFGGNSSLVSFSEPSTFFPPRSNGLTSSGTFSSRGQTPPLVNSKEAAEDGPAPNKAPKEKIVKEKAYEGMPDRSRTPTKELPSGNRLEVQELVQENGLTSREARKALSMEKEKNLNGPNLKALRNGRTFREEVAMREVAKVETPGDSHFTFSLSGNQEQEENQLTEKSTGTEQEGDIIEPDTSELAQQVITMRDEEEEKEEEKGVRPKEIWRLGLIYWDRTALLMPTTRFLDVCGAAFIFIFTISMVIYGIFHLAL